MNFIQSQQPTKPIADLFDHWANGGLVTLNSPISQQDLLAFEKRFGVNLPHSFASLLLLVNGFAQDGACQDQNGFNFLPLADVCRVPDCKYGQFEFDGAHQYYIFCEYLGYCWAYAMCLQSGDSYGSIVIVGTADGRPIRVSKDFIEFVALYLFDDEKLYC